MMLLKDILNLVSFSSNGNLEIEVSAIQIDSRKIDQNQLFVAIVGHVQNGHDYIQTAIQKGAIAIVCEQLPSQIYEHITYIVVKNCSEILGILASNFYKNPSSKIKVIGITGTNGKTTIATLAYQLFKNLGYKVGLISTVVNKIDDIDLVSTHTTPDAISVQFLLNQMVEASCSYCFMEVSSHAIDQGRINGIAFCGAVFSNITHDHLDYHLTFSNYIKAKKTFFDMLDEDAFALSNKDDKNGIVMLQNTKASKYYYALKTIADFKSKIIESDLNGTLVQIDKQEVWLRMVGEFNIYNTLAVYGIAFLTNHPVLQIITEISKINGAEGRFKVLKSKNNIYGIIDYAHTPDALENVLKTINQVRTKNETLTTIIGCGGNRDKEKRPKMAEIACKLSDKVVFTSDNPRFEDPEHIIIEMQKGVSPMYFKKVLKITDRADAINMVIANAKPLDIVLIAGKGHETYQEIKGEKLPFDDHEKLLTAFNTYL